MNVLRPYRAAFASRFATLLQYRAAALAGVTTQCWWGGLKVMILTAFFESGGATPIALGDAITYTWLAQALFTSLPWVADPDVAAAVRSGSVAYDQLRPVDTYSFWYVRSAGLLAARALPRALALSMIAALLLPAIGLDRFAWQPPANVLAALAFAGSLALAGLLSTAMLMLLNVAVLSFHDERGVNLLTGPCLLVLSGNLLPLSLYPDAFHDVLFLQPFASMLDIPLRIYFGELSGERCLSALGLQLFWITAFIALGRMALGRVLARTNVQGG